LNKTDRLTHSEEEALRHRVLAGYREPAVFVSAAESDGLVELRAILFDELRERRPAVRLEIASSDGQSIATVYREGEVLRQEQHDTRIELVARLPEATVGRLRQRGVLVTVEP
jgi:50S ribosomal subunit-associated GTPase HflX